MIEDKKILDIYIGAKVSSEELEKYIEELQEYASYEDTEVGEYWTSLVDLKREMVYMSDSFREAYEKEVIETLQFIKENYRLTEETIIPNVYPVKVKTLEWIGE